MLVDLADRNYDSNLLSQLINTVLSKVQENIHSRNAMRVAKEVIFGAQSDSSRNVLN